MPAKHVHFESSMLNHAIALVSETTKKLGLPKIYLAVDTESTNGTQLFICKYRSPVIYGAIFPFPVAILTSDSILRFFIPNDYGILQIIDLKNIPRQDGKLQKL